MHKRAAAKQPVRLFRWVFQRGNRAVTCQLERTGAGRAVVCVVPHWNVRDAAIERYEAGIRAFQRHAAIVADLRKAGWTLAERETAA